jgi:uncharacterized repeat protein (TIGR01451 family)
MNSRLPLTSPRLFHYTLCGLTLFAGATIGTIGIGVQTAQAEGSRELVQYGGNRPYLEWRGDSSTTTPGFRRRTLLKVYAEAGEIINLGSSGVGVGDGNIVVFDSSVTVDTTDTGTPLLNCKTSQPSNGKLDTRAKEIAGPLPNAGGYTPCTYTAPTTGIYHVAFYGPTLNGTGASSDPDKSTTGSSISAPVINTDQKSSVAMWDITVRANGSSIDIPGRTFTDYIALNLGDNGRQLNSRLYIVTADGYRYLTDMNGLDPFGFIFFADSRGIYSSASQNSIYRSAKISESGIMVEAPTHKVFFNPPDNTARTGNFGLRYVNSPVVPNPAQNFSFVAGTGGSGNQSPEGVGGIFQFFAPQTGSYQIAIDINRNGITDSVDRIIAGTITASGAITATWDGRDANGTIVAAAPGSPYPSKIILKGGEYHFPMIDAENNPSGLKIEMLSPPGPFSNGATAKTVYFNENGSGLGCTTNCYAINGVDSSSGAHAFSNKYGDNAIIDTWIYFPSSAVLADVIVTPKLSSLTVKKTAALVDDKDSSGGITPGDILEYTIVTTTPATSANVAGVILKDTIPANTSYVANSIKIDTVAKTDLATDDQAEFDSTQIIARLGTGASATAGGQLATDSSSTVTFRVAINDRLLPAGTTQIANQAIVSSTGNADKVSDDPSTVSTPDDPTVVKMGPRLRLVKRITGIKKSGDTAITPIANTIDDANDVDDNASVGWPIALTGITKTAELPTTLVLAPKDEIEYTIYFFADSAVGSQNVNLCDFIPANQAYILGTLTRQIGTTITNIADGSGNGPGSGFYTSAFPAACTATNHSNGAVYVQAGSLPSYYGTTPGNIDAAGKFTFRAVVK